MIYIVCVRVRVGVGVGVCVCVLVLHLRDMTPGPKTVSGYVGSGHLW